MPAAMHHAPLQRRHLLGLGLGAAASLCGLGGCVSPAPAAPGEPQAVAPGVYLLRGHAGEIGPENLGRTGNAGFIVGPTGVLAIDCGVSRRQGEAVLAAIRRTTPLPVRQLLLTHVRQEFLFGAAAFQAAGIPVAMHPAAARLMAARCENCLKTLQRILGPEEMQGTRVVKPERQIDPATQPFDAGIGRPVRLLAWGPGGHSSGPGDLAVLDDTTGTLFAGGLVDADTIPDVQDADFAGWRAGLAGLQALADAGMVQRVVPGHGPLAAPAQIGRVARYLDQLEHRTAELLDAGTALSDVADATALGEFATWDQYDTIHRRNASVVFLRHERALMLRQP
jgi:glyoxylase-like metal-dependent hydrolase (beta-lactamase superfamily II)